MAFDSPRASEVRCRVMMGCRRIDHLDIEAFLNAGRDASHFCVDRRYSRCG